jgi:hypothetical protein
VDQLFSNFRSLLGIVHRTLSLFSMSINWDPGKTEILLSLRGHRARNALAELPIHPVSRQPMLVHDDVACVITTSYKHVGTYIMQSGSMLEEINYRINKSHIHLWTHC